ncbi:MAG: cation:proton antiporter [Bellilinea sp.]|jgi:Kef-type K+ transport system membrane component KefB
MSSQDFIKFALQIAVMLACALLMGQFMRRIKQPAVLGELLGGIILGPTILGMLFPEAYSWLFRSSEEVAILRDASIKLGMLFFLFIAGLEINFSNTNKIGRYAVFIGLAGTLLPISFGVGLVYLIPHEFWGPVAQQNLLVFSLFIGLNLANTANPVIVRILLDLNLLKKEIGSLTLTATVVDDAITWTLFAVMLSLVSPARSEFGSGIGGILFLIAAFFVLMLTLGRSLAPRALRWVRQRVAWPSGFIAFTAIAILLVSSAAEIIGIHAFLGAFLLGVVVAGKHPEAEEAHTMIAQFVMAFFAPIYFVSIGMKTNFIANFDLLLFAIILLSASASKFLSVLLGARLAGMTINRQTFAIASGLNARGATGIILAGIGLSNGLIDERVFVALFSMAIITSMVAGPLMHYFLKGQSTNIVQVEDAAEYNPDKHPLPIDS